MSGGNPEPRRLRSQSEVQSDLLNASDANLAFAIARYQEDALAEAYRRHAGAVFGLARRLLHERSAAGRNRARSLRATVERSGAVRP